jgi:hypothetical protein
MNSCISHTRNRATTKNTVPAPQSLAPDCFLQSGICQKAQPLFFKWTAGDSAMRAAPDSEKEYIGLSALVAYPTRFNADEITHPKKRKCLCNRLEAKAFKEKRSVLLFCERHTNGQNELATR